MKIKIAGAGAGKTTTIAENIIELRNTIEGNKKIFCLAFTNNAVECIGNKLQEFYGTIPNNIIVSTIHSFLYQEVIKPFYYLLYDKQYQQIAVGNLPDNNIYKNKIIKELEGNNILHQTKIPERAKWIIVGKSKDTKEIKSKRNIIKNTLKKYCGAICIDEAQDIDNNISKIIESLNSLEIPLILMGDPKQDLRGYNSFKELSSHHCENVYNINICHRCPQNHLDLSNSIVIKSEKQYSNKKYGNLFVCFESDKKIKDLMLEKNFDLKYISQRQKNYETHSQGNTNIIESIYEEIFIIMKKKYSSREQLDIAKYSYFLVHRLLKKYEMDLNKKNALANLANVIGFRLKTDEYNRLKNLLPDRESKNMEEKIIISSIDSIKGQEGKNCLFILTTDLASYLLGTKTDDNKYKNRLYVALTRSLDELTIYITLDVENKFGKSFIEDFFRKYSFSKII